MNESPTPSWMGFLTYLLPRSRVIIALPLLLALTAGGWARFYTGYVSESRFMPVATSSPAQFMGLAAQIGLTPPSGTSPDLYMDMVGSAEVLGPVVEAEHRFRERDGVEYTGDLVELLDLKPSRPEARTRTGVSDLRDRVSSSINRRSGVITLRVHMPREVLSEVTNEEILRSLQAFDVERRRNQASEERRFMASRLEEAETEMRRSEAELAGFLDRNRLSADSPHLRYEIELLSAQAVERREVYLTLVQAFETARLDEARNTPVLTILDGPRESAREALSVVWVSLLTLLFSASLLLLLLGARYFFARELSAMKTAWVSGVLLALFFMASPLGAQEALCVGEGLLDQGRRAVTTSFASGETASWGVPSEAIPARLSPESEIALCAGAIFGTETGTLAPGRTEWTGQKYLYPGPVALSSSRSSTLLLGAEIPLSSSLRARARIGADPDPHLQEGWVEWDPKWVRVWGGRHLYGPALTSEGSHVIRPDVILGGVGVALDDPINLPGPLHWIVTRWLGPLHPSIVIHRLSHNGEVRNPWFLAQRIALSPHEGIRLSLSRAAIFGGGSMDTTPLNVGRMIIGLTGQWGHSSLFENQVASADLTLRLRTGETPALLSVRWGAEDGGASMIHVPALGFTLEIPRFAAHPDLAVSLSGDRFSGRKRGYPSWYRHGPLGDGWSIEGSALGHPIGGHGSTAELRIAHVSPEETSWRLLASWYYRGAENLYAPDREGHAARFEANARRPVETLGYAFLSLSVEKGHEWSASDLSLGLLFPLASRKMGQL